MIMEHETSSHQIDTNIIIDLNDSFAINDLIQKASDKLYLSHIEVIEDLLRVLCFIPTSQIYIIKDCDALEHLYLLTYKTKTSFKDVLNSIKLETYEKKWITVWNLFDSDFNTYFKKRGISFHTPVLMTLITHCPMDLLLLLNALQE
jgi:hypothetical protein